MSDARCSQAFVTLMKEGSLAGEIVCAGLNALRKATTPKSGLYELALFNLSIGFERFCKLVVLIDFYLANDSRFPTNDYLKKKYGHDLSMLFKEVARIVKERRIDEKYSTFPNSDIHQKIISTLSEFAKLTRYYNLDFLTGGKSSKLQSGSAAWVRDVGDLILRRHYSIKKQMDDILDAQELDASMRQRFVAIRFDETGDPISTLQEGLIHSAKVQVIQKWGQFYCLQLVRYLVEVLEELRILAYRVGSQDIPFFGELLSCFLNDDKMLKSRKTWEIPR